MTDNVIPLNPPPEKPKKEAKCSFCGKAESQVKHMIGNGMDKHICNECVVKAKQRLQEAA
jgi:hypothetical protein